MTTVQPIKKQLVVKAPVERAFRVFTEGMDRWWPREHHIGSAPMKSVHIEPKQGGRWYATSTDGTECDTGRVLVWEPPTRLVLSWQITADWKFDASFLTEIEVRFTKEGPTQTRVDFEHRKLEAYGDAAIEMAKQMGDPKGWPRNLEIYADAAAMKAVVTYDDSPVATGNPGTR